MSPLPARLKLMWGTLNCEVFGLNWCGLFALLLIYGWLSMNGVGKKNQQVELSQLVDPVSI